MLTIFDELQRQVIECRNKEVAKGCMSECYSVTKYKSYGGHEPQILLKDDNPDAQIVTVSVNPNWTCGIDESIDLVAGKKKNTGSIFHTYRNQLLSKLPVLTRDKVAHLELVQCGSPSRKEAFQVMDICRPRFFDKAIAFLRPEVIITIGRDAAEYFFSLSKDCKQGLPWHGLRQMHGQSVSVFIAGKDIKVVFAMQPSAGVSREKREFAANTIRDVYLNNGVISV